MSLWSGPGLDPEAAMARALQGVRIIDSERVDRGVVLWWHDSAPDEDGYTEAPALIMHPLTRWTMKVSLERGEPMGDLIVQGIALQCWIEERADRMAAASIRGMADMVRAYELRAEHHHRIRWCEVGRYWHRYERPEPDGFMRAVQQCTVCGQEATDESLVRAGVTHGRA